MQSNGDNMSIGDKVIISAPIGGTAEALGGGKPARHSDSGGGFSNGAVTGAFVYLLNHASQQGGGGRPQKQEQTNQYTKTMIPFGGFSIEYTLQEGFGFNGNTFYRGFIEINQIQDIWYVASYAEVIPSNAGTHMDYWANLKVYQDGKNVDYSYFNMENIAPTYYSSEWTRIGYGYAKMPLSGNVQIQINIGGSSYSFFKGHSNQIIFSKTYTFPK
jgi:hypothetical protein